ncbi:hypothetical protein V5O48_007357 [Marasmius crinis-equi]|uniref:ATP-dependent DNA ligase family profile domain-containing protein n=1 Tax=Marasmius crinis-equi TaxID=585013 RepID=A0ABR3FH11_9AGAR
MQENALAREVGKCLGISDEKLINWEAMGDTVCLGEQLRKVLEPSCSDPEEHCPLNLTAVDALLDELAAFSRWTEKSIRDRFPKKRRQRQDVLKQLFRPMTPFDAACLAQIILRDVRPLMYPLCEKQMHYTAALKEFKSNCVIELNRLPAMKVWDPTLVFLKSHRVCFSLEHAADAFERGVPMTEPVYGLQLEIPKSQKGRNLQHALSFFSGSKQVWAETKYDGERAQIHVRFTNGVPRIKIFSKSRRDSTLDRVAVHPIIADCLSRYDIQNIILDAEMVACSGQVIESFWKIRPLIESTAIGARRKTINEPEQETQDSQFTQSTAESDCPSHLALVFFDVMLLNGESLLDREYSERRGILETVIRVLPGKAMLAERWEIPMNYRKKGGLAGWVIPSKRAAALRKEDEEYSSPENTLGGIFAEILASHKEGLVLKAAESGYNDWKLPWVKLKMDYIPGLGDSVDLAILGAGWRKERGNELRVPRTTYTTFFIGALQNAKAVAADPNTKPDFMIHFTASYGLSRDQLEEINFLIKSSEPVPFRGDQTRRDFLPYDFNLGTQEKPQVLLRQPLLAELFGDRFIRRSDDHPFEIRWPRILKVHRTSERSWRAGLSLHDLQVVAATALGLDQDIVQNVRRIWKRENSVQPGDDWDVRCQKWEKDLGVEGSRRKTKVRDPASPRKRQRPLNGHKEASQPTEDSNDPPSGSQPLRIATNLPESSTSTSEMQNSASGNQPSEERCAASENSRTPPTSLFLATRRKYPSPPTSPAQATPPSPVVVQVQMDDTRIEHEHSPVAVQNVDSGPALVEFLQNAVIWYDPSSPVNSFRDDQGAITPLLETHLRNNRVHGPEALLTGCGWHPTTSRSPWVDKAVVFLDPTTQNSRIFEQGLLSLLKTRMSSISGRIRRPMWVFNGQTFDWNKPYRDQVLRVVE